MYNLCVLRLSYYVSFDNEYTENLGFFHLRVQLGG